MTILNADLIFWRHADTEINSPSGLDADRRLTEKGWRDAHNSASWLSQQLPTDVQVFCSPILRCQQTVSALKSLRPEVMIYTADYLSTQADVHALLAHIRQMTALECVMFVGHQPNLGVTIAKLVGNSRQCDVQKNAIWWLRSKTFKPNATYDVLQIQQTFI